MGGKSYRFWPEKPLKFSDFGQKKPSDFREDLYLFCFWRSEVESRTQGSRPRTQKIRGQDQGQPFRGQTLSRPRTGMLEAKAKDQGHKRKCSPKKKRSSQKFFKRSPRKSVFQKIFQALHKILTILKILLSSSRGQANFWGLEASRPRPRTSKCVLEAKDVLEDSTSVGDHHRWAQVC